MPRKRIGAQVRAWHANGTSAPVGEAADVTSVRISLPGLDWLHRVDVDIDAKTGTVEITVVPADEDAPHLPRLAVDPDLSITART